MTAWASRRGAGERRVKHFTLATVDAKVKAGAAKTVTLQVPAGALHELGHNAASRLAVALIGGNGNGKRRVTAVLSARIP